jgi:hypothetical protein
MAARSEQDVIIDHALRDEENLAIAIKIGLAYPELCGRVIAGFLEAVVHELTPRLGAKWKIARCHDTAELGKKEVVLLSATYLGSPGDFRVELNGLESGFPKTVYLAVRCDTAATESSRLEHVRATINDGYASGRKTDYSLWWRPIDKAYSQWGGEETTVLLHRKGDTLTYFAGHLERLALSVEKGLKPASQ